MKNLLPPMSKILRKTHVYGCVSYESFGSLMCFEENLTAKKMIKLYQNVFCLILQKSGLVITPRSRFYKNIMNLNIPVQLPKHEKRIVTTITWLA